MSVINTRRLPFVDRIDFFYVDVHAVETVLHPVQYESRQRLDKRRRRAFVHLLDVHPLAFENLVFAWTDSEGERAKATDEEEIGSTECAG